jgi:hypothetical protein
VSEQFLFLFEGGPFSGQTKQLRDRKQEKNFTWPLDETILAIDHHGTRDSTGYYQKYWESQGEPKPGQARGAKYKWIPYNQEAEDTPIGGYL